MQAQLSWRKPTAHEIPACLALHPAKNGSEFVGARECLRAWEHILRSRYAARPAVIERHAGQKATIAGFGCAVFVRKAYAEAELCDPRPGLNARLIKAIVAGSDPLASLEEIRVANSRGDLQQLALDASWDDTLPPLERDDVGIMLAAAYGQLFAGFHIGRLITELVDARDASYANSFPDIAIASRFESFYAKNPDSQWNCGRALAVITSEKARTYPGSLAASVLYQHQLPHLGFTQGEKDLLEAATDGHDDLAASSELGVTLSAIKKRWSSIFQRVAFKMPDLCPDDASDTRGLQKRNRILTYVRQHPEEMRPFDESAAEG